MYVNFSVRLRLDKSHFFDNPLLNTIIPGHYYHFFMVDNYLKILYLILKNLINKLIKKKNVKKIIFNKCSYGIICT